MKKFLCLILVILFVVTSAFAADGFDIHAGTSLYLTHVGASYNEGPFELGVTFNTAFPNLAIAAIVQQAIDHASAPESFDAVTPEFVGGTLLESLTLGAILSVDTSVDVVPSKKFDLDLGLSGCAVVAPELFGDDPFTILAMCASLRATWNFNEHSGLYFGTQFPLAALTLGFDEVDGKRTLDTEFCSIVPYDDDSFLLVGYIVSVYTARIGYVYHF